MDETSSQTSFSNQTVMVEDDKQLPFNMDTVIDHETPSSIPAIPSYQTYSRSDSSSSSLSVHPNDHPTGSVQQSRNSESHNSLASYPLLAFPTFFKPDTRNSFSNYDASLEIPPTYFSARTISQQDPQPQLDSNLTPGISPFGNNNNTNSDLRPDPSLITETDFHSNPDQIPDLNPDLNSDLNPDPNPDLNPDRNPDLSTDRNSDLNPDRNPDLNPDQNSDLNPDRNPDLNPDRYPNSNPKYPGSNPNRNQELNPDQNPDLNPNRNPDLNPDRNPYLDSDRNSDLNSDRNRDLNPDRNSDLKYADQYPGSDSVLNLVLNLSLKQDRKPILDPRSNPESNFSWNPELNPGSNLRDHQIRQNPIKCPESRNIPVHRSRETQNSGKNDSTYKESEHIEMYSVSFSAAINLALIVYCCFSCLFGILALALAVSGRQASADGDILKAESKRRWSYFWSVVGIVVGVALIALSVIGYRTYLFSHETRTTNSPSIFG